MHKFKVKFYLRPVSNKKGYQTIQVRIYLDHQRDYLTSTKIVVPAKLWNASLEKVVPNTPEGRLMNHRLQNIRKQITDIYLQYENDERLSIGFIKDTYLAYVKAISGKEGVCSFFMQYIKENAETVSEDSHRRYVQIANLFGRYVAYAYNTADIDFADIDHQMLQEFESYLHFDEGYTHARTLKNKIGLLRNLIGAAHELGMMEQDPFEGYVSSGLFPAKTECLTIDEIKSLRKAEFNTARLERVRDCFLFSCYTGLSHQELKSLSSENVTRLNGGTWILLTGANDENPRYIPLLPYPATILKKYRNDEAQVMLLPLISQQKSNLYLKEIAKICAIDKRLTFQTAVQSFIKIALTAGMSIDSVSHMLGKPLYHTKPSSRFSPERIGEEMTLFSAKIGKNHPPETD